MSLYFSNYSRLVITLPEHSVDVRLLLTSCSPTVKIRYYKAIVSGSQVQYQQAGEEKIVTREELESNEISYYDPDNPVIKIIIEPQKPVFEEIAAIEEQIQVLRSKFYSFSTGEINNDNNGILYKSLLERLDQLHSADCSDSDKELRSNCKMYQQDITYVEKHISELLENVYLRSTDVLIFTAGEFDTYKFLLSELYGLRNKYCSSIECRIYYEHILDVEGQIRSLLSSIPTNPTEVIFTKNDTIAFNKLLAKLDSYRSQGCCYYVETSNPCCNTCLQQIRWLSVESYRYNELLPSTQARQTDQEKMLRAVSKIQPVWRPETKYYVHFQLKDVVALNKANQQTGVFDYYYGFTTSGTVGHYRRNEITDLLNQEQQSPLSEPQKNLLEKLKRMNLLAKYIDFMRSYPNADGNLLQSKPLFYGNGECKINIFFTQSLTYHLLNNFPEYNGLVKIGANLNIKIKDPSSDVLIPYPLNGEIDAPTAKGNGSDGSIWITDDNPRVPVSVRLINNLLEDVPCTVYKGNLVPTANAYSVKLVNLKPSKMYTALLYNAFNSKNGDLSDNENTNNVEIHSFVFQTSRYENFEKQVKSYLLKDENGNERKAVFELITNIAEDSENDVYNIVKQDKTANILPDLSLKYSHDFDKLIEGVLLLKPLEVAQTTEFNIIRNQKTDRIIAILVRNPEPFNDPKIPLDEISKTIIVLNDNNEEFKTLYSKDYSQAIIAKKTRPITESNLTIQFQYKLWNGNEYEQKDTITVNININQ